MYILQMIKIQINIKYKMIKIQINNYLKKIKIQTNDLFEVLFLTKHYRIFPQKNNINLKGFRL